MRSVKRRMRIHRFQGLEKRALAASQIRIPHCALRIRKLRLDSLIDAENSFALFDRPPALELADIVRIRSFRSMFDEKKTAGFDRGLAAQMIDDSRVFFTHRKVKI